MDYNNWMGMLQARDPIKTNPFMSGIADSRAAVVGEDHRGPGYLAALLANQGKMGEIEGKDLANQLARGKLLNELSESNLAGMLAQAKIKDPRYVPSVLQEVLDKARKTGLETRELEDTYQTRVDKTNAGNRGLTRDEAVREVEFVIPRLKQLPAGLERDTLYNSLISKLPPSLREVAPPASDPNALTHLEHLSKALQNNPTHRATMEKQKAHDDSTERYHKYHDDISRANALTSAASRGQKPAKSVHDLFLEAVSKGNAQGAMDLGRILLTNYADNFSESELKTIRDVVTDNNDRIRQRSVERSQPTIVNGRIVPAQRDRVLPNTHAAPPVSGGDLDRAAGAAAAPATGAVSGVTPSGRSYTVINPRN